MMMMIRLTVSVLLVLLSLVSVDSGNNSQNIPNNSHSDQHNSNMRNHNNNNNNNNNSNNSNNSSSISRNSNTPKFAAAAQPSAGFHKHHHLSEEDAAATNGRDKRGTNSFQLDQSEIARQNQITQQIFANFLERRLFPNRTVNQKIPTIADILPKPKPSSRPRPRGFAASGGGHFKRNSFGSSGGGVQRNRLAAAAGKRQASSHRNRFDDPDDEPLDQQPQANTQDDFDYEGQESLQSVESEQHDQYYGDIFHRDPSENEIDSVDCPNCVDESQYTPNKWTMPLLKLGEKRYYLGIFFKANWFKATQYCRYHGMHLASISSQEENDRLEKHIRDFGLGHEHFWISGTDLADEGNFFWMATGRPITFTNWNAGEPNNFRYENGEEENCLELWNRDGKGLKWNDSPCSFETYFVCEVQPN
ncbi:macrophage mannose receptor 1 [Scaptodrosophila lebanonensis]|uniref:Macrophage mannose receptor 1 n=1 Tax=Drosophila lebanonensis TaxID=7225 RepID=A0A6J2TJA4_DROLE|nr:macrophage mannose receptor 1 [Scaptodrosophila lebanonensis]